MGGKKKENCQEERKIWFLTDFHTLIIISNWFYCWEPLEHSRTRDFFTGRFVPFQALILTLTHIPTVILTLILTLTRTLPLTPTLTLTGASNPDPKSQTMYRKIHGEWYQLTCKSFLASWTSWTTTGQFIFQFAIHRQSPGCTYWCNKWFTMRMGAQIAQMTEFWVNIHCFASHDFDRNYNWTIVVRQNPLHNLGQLEFRRDPEICILCDVCYQGDGFLSIGKCRWR